VSHEFAHRKMSANESEINAAPRRASEEREDAGIEFRPARTGRGGRSGKGGSPRTPALFASTQAGTTPADQDRRQRFPVRTQEKLNGGGLPGNKCHEAARLLKWCRQPATLN